MNAKTVTTFLLLTFVGLSVVYLVVQELRPAPVVKGDADETGVASTAPAASGPARPSGRKLIVYYFHRTQRCRDCLNMEDYAHDALKDGFPNALESGAIEWRAVNVEQPGQEHFVEKYDVTSSGVVLVDMRNGKQEGWQKLVRVWELVDHEADFKAYVKTEARALLEPGS